MVKISVVVSQESGSSQPSSGMLARANSQTPNLKMEKRKSYLADVENHYATIVKTLLKQYQTKNIKVKIAVMKTLSVVALMMQNDLENYLDQIVPIIF